MYKVIKDFSGSPDGAQVLQYTKGQVLEICSTFSEDLAQVALAEKWVSKAAAKKAPAKKAAKSKSKK